MEDIVYEYNKADLAQTANTITGLGYLEMMYDEQEMFGVRTVQSNSPYLHGPTKRRFSWLVSYKQINPHDPYEFKSDLHTRVGGQVYILHHQDLRLVESINPHKPQSPD